MSEEYPERLDGNASIPIGWSSAMLTKISLKISLSSSVLSALLASSHRVSASQDG